jgi:hypothetical protein
MVCAICGKFLNKGEEFVLIGTYPTFWRLFKLWFFEQSTMFEPEDFGWVYHKSCFMKMLTEKQQQEIERSMKFAIKTGTITDDMLKRSKQKKGSS